MTTKYVYYFGPQGTEGDATMKNVLGGKGANLAEMAKLGLPVPAGFTISTEFCTVYFAEGRQFPESLKKEVTDALRKTEGAMGMTFGDPENPLLLSCRSGARQSMPGMMETVLNVGLCAKTIPGLIKKSNNERFVYDAYRRLIMMYSDVVMEKAEDIEPEEGKGIRVQLEHLMARAKKNKARALNKKPAEISDTDLSAADLKKLCGQFKKKVQEVLGREFPDDPQEQLWGAVGAVFKSWEGRRAVAYRKIEGIPGQWGTACNVQSMVFGNLGDTSATGVAFSRNPATGENKFYGEWLINCAGRGRGGRHPHAQPVERRNQEPAESTPAVARDRVARIVPPARRYPQPARTALPRHAGYRVYDPRGQALHAPVPQRQADRHRRPEHGHGHVGRGPYRREDRRYPCAAGAARRAPAPDYRPGRGEERAAFLDRPARRTGRAPAARSSSLRSPPSRQPSGARK